MLRVLTITLALSAFSTTAMAHPEPENTAPKSITKMERPELPSKTEIQEAIKQMPDMNAIMGDMMGMMKDERFRDNMESSARAFGDKLERSGALKAGKDGMPDFNNALAAMLETFSDEEGMGGMMDTMMGLAAAMEKHAPEISETAKSRAPKTAKAPKKTPKLEDLHQELNDLRAEVEELRKEKASK
jgi:hypothetical protein